ncbi:HAD hydrolase family protein [Halobaculum sp. CBA1158]|uniref:HAD hydrolase family protein n=1 Tax=Halobaculum sp. CBA1158 TaxID=2904243 RepID=UPI001F402A4C|nr:HAD hydrolase family protein [Halobaculum sp. CBA1158]UIO99119.1 HAD hydrolase family protein [Halobaculum sp. CBA1158]
MTADAPAMPDVPPDADLPPLALDIDGTLTTPEHAVDPRVFHVLPAWPAPVVLATGKSFPYPVALCHFAGVPERVVAENGGVVCVDETVAIEGDADRIARAVDAFRERGGDLGWGAADTVNRWRETEVAASRTADETLLRAVADEFDLRFLDTGYAYHLTDPTVSKGSALETAAATLGVDPAEFVAVGDSMNDASTFEVAGESYALANADETARSAADRTVEAGFMDGTIEVLSGIVDRASETD